MKTSSFIYRFFAEVLGTFGFFFLGFMGLAAGALHPASIGNIGMAAGFGLGLALMIFAFGHISGGHFNPAVTLGLACGGRFPWGEVLPYWFAQVLGGLGAAGLVRGLFTDRIGRTLVNGPAPGVSDMTAFLLEAVATFLFLLVISAVATDERAPWHGVFAPAAIGGFIFIAATVIGPFTSGSFNPARSLAPAIVSTSFSHLWIFVTGPAVGGALGGLVFSRFRHAGSATEVKEEPLVGEHR
jgi:aquaporin NIP